MSLHYGRTILLLVFLFAGFISTAGAGVKTDLWPRWKEHDPSSTKTVDHALWARFLNDYVVSGHPSGVNRVRYAQASRQGQTVLRDYLKGLQDVRVSLLNRAEQKAYWMNLYNALTIKVVLDHYPVESIQDIDISPGLFGFFIGGPWKAKLVEVEGEKIALDDIEHRILRPIWQDNRIHYGVNCASIGCPNLRPEPFSAENTDRLLTRGAEDYVNHPRGVRIDTADRMIASSIYKWFQGDFDGTEKGVVQHLIRYAEPSLAERLKSFDGTISYTYDWSLNGLE
jgi:hypothetical protein